MSSTKSTLPTLNTGVTKGIKTRKRDEKEKYDPAAFRNSILIGFHEILSNNSSPTSNPNNSNIQVVPEKPGSNHSSPDSESLPPVPAVASDSTSTEEPSANDESVTNGTTTTSPSPPIVVPISSDLIKSRFDSISKFLDDRGSKRDDFRKYGEILFDILIAGGILAPGGNIIDSDSGRTDFCVFKAEDPESIRGFANVIVKLIRRYKYLEKTLEEEFNKILKFLKGFTPDERKRLANLTAILIAGGQVPVSVLSSAIYDQSVKDGCSATFFIAVLQSWLQEKDSATVWSSLKKSGLDQRVYEFFPTNRRTPEYLESTFSAEGIGSLLQYQKAGIGDRAKKGLQARLAEMVKESGKVDDMIAFTKETATKNKLAEHEVVVLLWNTIMNNVEWNKKDDLVEQQAVKHVKQYAPLLEKWTSTAKSELALIVRVQEFCYENMNFLKVFTKIVQWLYKTEVVSEDAILKWYKDGHSAKGRTIFLEQAKPFVQWLEQAEEESDEEN